MGGDEAGESEVYRRELTQGGLVPRRRCREGPLVGVKHANRSSEPLDGGMEPEGETDEEGDDFGRSSTTSGSTVVDSSEERAR